MTKPTEKDPKTTQTPATEETQGSTRPNARKTNKDKSKPARSGGVDSLGGGVLL